MKIDKILIFIIKIINLKTGIGKFLPDQNPIIKYPKSYH